jgi:hypothetical protein
MKYNVQVVHLHYDQVKIQNYENNIEENYTKGRLIYNMKLKGNSYLAKGIVPLCWVNN